MKKRGTSVKLNWIPALLLKIGKPMVGLVQLVIILVEASFGSSPNSLFNGSLLGVSEWLGRGPRALLLSWLLTCPSFLMYGAFSAWCWRPRLWDGLIIKEPFPGGLVASATAWRGPRAVEGPLVMRAEMCSNNGGYRDFRWLLSHHRGLLLLQSSHRRGQGFNLPCQDDQQALQGHWRWRWSDRFRCLARLLLATREMFDVAHGEVLHAGGHHGSKLQDPRVCLLKKHVPYLARQSITTKLPFDGSQWCLGILQSFSARDPSMLKSEKWRMRWTTTAGAESPKVT